MDLGLAGKRYLVTGASRGLGLATAAALIDEGAEVSIVARGVGDLSAAVASLGDGATAIATDLSQPDSAEQLAATVGSVDGVLVNVGGPSPGAVLDLDPDQWHAAIDGVFLASVRLLRAFAPLIRDGGSLLVVLSTSIKEPIASLGASTALRPGLALVVKDVANSLAPRVRVNGILPGRIATARLQEVHPGDLGADIPLGRPGRPEEFGRVAAFLLSPAASYITGSLVTVDGGLLRSPW